MATPYSIIYDRALAKLTDYDLAFLPDDDFRFMLRGWLNSSISKFRKCASDLSNRDDELEIFNLIFSYETHRSSSRYHRARR